MEPTNLFVPSFAFALIFAVRAFKSGEKKDWAKFGAISAVSVLIQPVYFGIFLAILVFGAIKKRKAIWTAAAIFLVLATPWTIRNYAEFGRFIPFKSPFWMNFYVGTLPEYAGLGERYAPSEETRREVDSLVARAKNEAKAERVYKKAFLDFVYSSPEKYLILVAKHILDYWTWPPRYEGDDSLAFAAARKIPVLVLNVLFAVGLAIAFKRDKKIVFLTAAILLYFTAVYGLTQAANVRFKLDAEWIELFAAAEAALFFANARAKRERL